MPRIKKVGRAWYSDIRIAGKRVRKPLSTDKQVAEERLRDLIADRDAARYGHAPKDSTWASFRAKYLEYSEGSKAPATAERDLMAIQALERFHRPAKLSDVTPELLERWKGARRKEGRGNATINRDMRAVKSLMRKAHDWGYIKEWKGASVKKLRETRGRLLFYSPDEVRRLLTVCKSRFSAFYEWETICLLGVRAGLRRSEIYWLSWRDVDLTQGMLSIVPKEGWQPKTGEQRHIPIPDDLARHLRKKTRVGPWVIGERPSLPVMSAFFRKISRKARLQGNLHTLRHTYASHLVQAGVDLYTVSKLLGHSDVNQTSIYAHLAPATLKEAVNKLPSL